MQVMFFSRGFKGARFMLVLALIGSLAACGKTKFYSGNSKEKPEPPAAGGPHEAEANPSSGIQEGFGEVPEEYRAGVESGGGTSGTGQTSGSSGQTSASSGETSASSGQTSASTGNTAGGSTGPETPMRTLVGIKVPETLTLAPGESREIPVLAVYSDKTEEVVTPQASFVSDRPEVVVVKPSPVGTVQGVSEGAATITVTYQNQPKYVKVNVEPYTVDKLRIEPASVTLRSEDSLQLKAIATLTSGKDIDFTANVEWKSANEAVVATEPKVAGLIKAKTVTTPQNVVVRVVYSGSSKGPIEATRTVRVLPLPGYLFSSMKIEEASSSSVGTVALIFKVTYLRAGESFKAELPLHTVDVKPFSYGAMKLSERPTEPGWFDATIEVRAYFRHVPDGVAVVYEDQVRKYELSLSDGRKLSYLERFDYNNTKENPVRTDTLQGTAGHPTAIPAKFPE